MKKIKGEFKSLPFKGAFTLIELLVTASVVGMIALAIFSTFAGGLNIYKRVQRYSGNQTDALLSLEKIEKNLRNTFNFADLDFIGEQKKISFPSLIKIHKDGDKAGGGISLGRITYYFDDKRSALVEQIQTYPPVTQQSDIHNKVRTLAVIKDVDFSYLSFDAENKSYEWKEIWDVADKIPWGVAVRLKFKETSKTVELERKVFIPAAASQIPES